MVSKAFGVEITGLDELQDKINRLPPELARRAIRSSLRVGAKVLLEAIRANSRRLTGWMASQIYIRVKTNNLDEGTATVGFTRKSRPGSKPNSKDKGGVSAVYEALYLELGTVKESAKPFIRPAFEASKDNALNAFVGDLRENLNEVFGK